MTQISNLQVALNTSVGDVYDNLLVEYGEITLECSSDQYHALMLKLRDEPSLAFEQLTDLCGIDYLTYAGRAQKKNRFAVVSHLLSVKHNWRLRVRVFAEDVDLPVVDSVSDIYNGVDWYEREAFDFYGIVFANHADLRRILTDYGFVGHPFRKDFPISGYVEMRYEESEGRVIYQPVSIEPREVTPRIVREDGYGG